MAIKVILLSMFFLYGTATFEDSPNMDRICNYRLLNVYLCDNSNPMVDLKVDVYETNDEGSKAANMELDLDTTFTEEFKASIRLDKWNNGGWDENFYALDDNYCKVITDFISDNWVDFRQRVRPPMSGTCSIEPGHYTISKFSVAADQIEFPAYIPGRYRMFWRTIDAADVEVLCHTIEFECN